MKSLPFTNRILMTLLMAVGMFITQMDAFGQCYCNGVNCTLNVSTVDCSFAAGEGASASAFGACALAAAEASGTSSVAMAGATSSGAGSVAMIGGTSSGSGSFAFIGESSGTSSCILGEGEASGDNSFLIGLGATAGDYTYAFGEWVGTGASNTHNMTIGGGIFGTTGLVNDIDNSIMLGMNSDFPTLYIEGAEGTTGAVGHVGIGTTDPDGLLHLKDESGEDTYMFIEKGDGDNGGIIWHNGAMGPTGASAGLVLESTETLRLRNAVEDQNLVLNINDGGTDKEAIYIQGTTANVGIGTSSPSVRLHVLAEDGEETEPIARFSTDDASYGFLQLKNTAPADTEFAPSFTAKADDDEKPALQFIAIASDDVDQPILEFDCRYFNGSTEVAPSSRPLFQLRVPGTGGEKLLVDHNGNLGVGTTSPGYLLDVQGGDINASGYVRANGTPLTSDVMFKTGIDSIGLALDIIDALRPRTYFFDTLNFNGVGKFNFESVRQYGFIAQEVETVLPELVSFGRKSAVTDTLGNVLVDAYTYRTLNYTSLVPILTKGIQELVSENENLRSELSDLHGQVQQLASMITNCCGQTDASYRLSEEGNGQRNRSKQVDVKLSDVRSVILEQNVPNPFAERTVIQYTVAAEASQAQILFHDAQGRLVQTVGISGTGSGSLNVFASDLTSGTYTYSLVVDGKVMDSKRMVKAE